MGSKVAAGKKVEERERETSEKRDRVERILAEEDEVEGQGGGTAGGDTEWAAVDDTDTALASMRVLCP